MRVLEELREVARAREGAPAVTDKLVGDGSPPRPQGVRSDGPVPRGWSLARDGRDGREGGE